MQTQRTPTWRSYGHWWIEIDEHESYGWWPASLPAGVRDVFGGCLGVLCHGQKTLAEEPSRTRAASGSLFSGLAVLPCRTVVDAGPHPHSFTVVGASVKMLWCGRVGLNQGRRFGDD